MTRAIGSSTSSSAWRDQAGAAVLRVASRLLNDPHVWSTERVNIERLRRGNARVVFSVLHNPFNEMDLDLRYGGRILRESPLADRGGREQPRPVG